MKIRRLVATDNIPMDLLLQADPSEEIVLEYLQRGECFVMEDEDSIIGVYVLIPTRPETAELVNVSIHEDQQGKGLGKMLIQHSIATAKSKKYKTIEVGTGNSSISQIALYQKCGFRITHVDRDFFIRHYSEPIFENGIQCIDMVRLSQDLY
ncbi:GNAT family N-acetyltransferase [Viridibacillus sp. FSL R5-0477]|uniref:Acetyltransferase n=1 Tax=Viridibacillus arenosi FSL R5-213 TaxID=1227360 RepID=W4F0R6_9BACL|nr:MULTISPECIES: GNAT family N-acetyltransferase [Viridibacillus]ETT86433.1 acetyltransferase [Viridibacillus arenosi FSL R5-213]OMC84682.1 N-acetyltransferase [Viridibacillus sp. FSL H8-0123]OMC86099.1 N-acetyltransferase [Viridibacillus sp. FSL H7-0596]OMC91729.1 N-acetyltransferase [Viridibacillus arenosi]